MRPLVLIVCLLVLVGCSSLSGTGGKGSIASTVLLDDEGRIAASVQGRIPTTQTLVSLVEKILDE